MGGGHSLPGREGTKSLGPCRRWSHTACHLALLGREQNWGFWQPVGGTPAVWIMPSLASTALGTQGTLRYKFVSCNREIGWPVYLEASKTLLRTLLKQEPAHYHHHPPIWFLSAETYLFPASLQEESLAGLTSGKQLVTTRTAVCFSFLLL